MIYRESLPHPLLAPYVRCYWSLRAPNNPFTAPERLVPDGGIELIFNFSDGYVRRDGTNQNEQVVGSHWVGPRVGYYLIDQLGAIHHVAIRFAPGGMYYLLGIPVAELRSRTLPAADLVPELRTLETQLYDAPDDKTQITLLNNFLLAHLRATRAEPTLFTHALASIQHAQGALTVDELAAGCHCSPRTLERIFLQWTGHTPKQMAQITRFLALLAHLRRQPGLRLLDNSMEGGYYDQSHLAKEFLRFTGLPPRQYLRETHWIAEQVTALAPRPPVR